MITLVDGVLFAALVGTSACVVPMYLKLKRLDRTQAEFGRAMAASGLALATAGDAVRGFAGEGREILAALGLRIEEARATLADLEAGHRALRTAGGAEGQASGQRTGLHIGAGEVETTRHR